MKKLVLFLICILFSSILLAQVTKEQAGKIIYEYIIDEELRTDCLLLYTTDKLPNTEGFSKITNSNNETFSVEYPCWVYFINEWSDVNGPHFRRYLFVNKSSGKILEIKTRNDFGPTEPAFENWQLIYSAITGLPRMESEFECIKIFDTQGKQVLQVVTNGHDPIQKINMSTLNKGVYIVNIFDATKNIGSFKILKK